MEPQPIQRPQYRIYSKKGRPEDIWSLSGFCRERGLNYQAMRDVVCGRRKEYQGWHVEPARAEREMQAIEAYIDRLDENEAKYGYAFKAVKRTIPGKGTQICVTTDLE